MQQPTLVLLAACVAAAAAMLSSLSRHTRAFSVNNANPQLSVVLITVPNLDVGRKIANSIVQEKLAACVNIVRGVESIYMWDGKLNQDNEDMLVIKTQNHNLVKLSARVHELHPYDVPEFIALPIEHASDMYRAFVLNNSGS